jgi:hypothetical protein
MIGVNITDFTAEEDYSLLQQFRPDIVTGFPDSCLLNDVGIVGSLEVHYFSKEGQGILTR